MEVRIRICNWEKYNGRCDVKNPSWLRFQQNFFHDNKISNLDDFEKLFFVWLLCEASKNKNDLFFLDGMLLQSVQRVSQRVSQRDIQRAIKKMVSLQLIETRTVRGRYADVGNPDATLQDETLQDKTRHNTVEFDFELLYQKYPRKVGKAEGIARLKTMIKTDQDYQDFSKAIDFYIAYLKKAGTEAQYIKHFSTFVGSAGKPAWRDWLDPNAGESAEMKKEYDWSFLKEETK